MEAVNLRQLEHDRVVNECFKKIATASVVLTLTEARFNPAAGVKTIKIDERAVTNTANALYTTEDMYFFDMKFETKDRNSAMAFRMLYKSYLERQTEELKKDSNKRYLLSFDAIHMDDHTDVSHRVEMINPILCVMEEYNTDYILHMVFLRDHVNFYEEEIDNYKIEEELQYEMIQEEEAGIRGSSSSSEMDEDEDF